MGLKGSLFASSAFRNAAEAGQHLPLGLYRYQKDGHHKMYHCRYALALQGAI